MHDDWNIYTEPKGTFRCQCECGWKRWALVEAVAIELMAAHIHEYATPAVVARDYGLDCYVCGCEPEAHMLGRCAACISVDHEYRSLDNPVYHPLQSRQSSGGTAPMAHMPNTRLPALTPSPDGKWLHCPQCSKGYWGAFRPTDFIVEKFTAHVTRKHAVDAPLTSIGAAAEEAAAADLLVKAAPAPKVAKAVAAKPARKPAKAKVAKIAAKAQAKGDGAVKIVREAGPSTADLLGDAMADILNDMQGELNPRLQLAQGPRQYSDHREVDREVVRKDHNRGQDVVARVQAQLSPLKGW